MSLPRSIPLLSAEQARAADAFTVDTRGIPGIVLMEHAGRAVALYIAARAPGSVAIFCGPGNNGGDGYVIARHLGYLGVATDVYAARVRSGGDAERAYEMYERSGGPTYAFDDFRPHYDVVVDALFGTGLTRPLSGIYAEAAGQIAGPFVVAVDLPSGIPTDGQRPDGPFVLADVTITFGGFKIAHYSEPGADACGQVIDARIGIEFQGECQTRLLPKAKRPTRPSFCHKGNFGHVGVVCGQHQGAAELAAYAALRAGAAKVSVLGAATAVRFAEIMQRPHLQLGGIDTLVVGPGLGEEADLARRYLSAKVPMVVDAEALDHAQGPGRVYTPHPGEAARLLGVAASDIQRDRLAALDKLSAKLGGVTLLKGAVPALTDGQTRYLIEGGHPALAVGGSGDVLAGIIAAELAVGASPLGAAYRGASRHQLAGAKLQPGALASEIADALR